MEHRESAGLIVRRVFVDRAFSSSQVVAALSSPKLRGGAAADERSFKYLKGLAKDVDEGAIRSFLTSNAMQTPIRTIYGELENVIIIDDVELRKVMEPIDRNWTGFYKQFPNSKGIVYLSAPGFSADGTQCVLEVGQQQGGLWGHGVAYLYRRLGNEWSKGGEIRTWVS
jgi:hypothetical protein